ncbi:RNase adapter RapZ [Marinibactrum halimedae]|uniref:Nucleotide-binding protein n=1 Tax=Marinibactrum halimedae TaxID=1444977 RepID=A0AA37T1P8_9GAMM|nr:RNase adapter RapZ [Marinibactrum halimedae]MCD9457521.1 RNase adapter RapZ [Marinibactrum halimedae]GLS25425.1 nucleotide-binding protein [Marinibactrum halimedae]
MRLIIISGRSGSGKSAALHVLEDAGYVCIDNLPLKLLPALVEEECHTEQTFAVSVDARTRSCDLAQFTYLMDKHKEKTQCTEILYLDARDDVLIKRYSETRRKHPLSSKEVDLKAAILKENDLLAPIQHTADKVVDTSHLSLHQLRDLVKKWAVKHEETGIALQFQSFGFKRGVPADADLMFDVRCLPNPYWVPELRSHSGLDEPVAEFLSSHAHVQEMVDDITFYLNRWLPRFEASNRSYMTVAIGCTGGHHRSVYVSQQLKQRFVEHYDNVQVRHRDLPCSD